MEKWSIRVLWNCLIDRQIGFWNDELNWVMTKFKGRSLKHSIWRMAWTAIICYHIWMDRNEGIHNGRVRSEGQILKAVKARWCEKKNSKQGQSQKHNPKQIIMLYLKLASICHCKLRRRVVMLIVRLKFTEILLFVCKSSYYWLQDCNLQQVLLVC